MDNSTSFYFHDRCLSPTSRLPQVVMQPCLPVSQKHPNRRSTCNTGRAEDSKVIRSSVAVMQTSSMIRRLFDTQGTFYVTITKGPQNTADQ